MDIYYLAGQTQPVQSLVVHQGEAVLGEVVVTVERMPVSEPHLSLHLRVRVPPPGEAGVVVASGQPPASLSPGDGHQAGEEGGEQLTGQTL